MSTSIRSKRGGPPASRRAGRQAAEARRTLNGRAPHAATRGGPAFSFPVKRLPLDSIRTDGDTQAREAMKPDVVAEYAEAIRAGAKFPPIITFHDGTDYWPGDGFHRHAGHRAAGRKFIRAEVRPGTQRDAVLYAVGANAAHGLRRTNDDKRRAVGMLLGDKEWTGWSDREIARRCGVDNGFVSRLRRQGEAVVKPHPAPGNGTSSTTAPTPATAPVPAGPAPRLSPHILRESINASARAEAARDAALKLPECHGCGGEKERQPHAYYFPILCERCMRTLPKPLFKAIRKETGDKYAAALAEALEYLEAKQLAGSKQ